MRRIFAAMVAMALWASMGSAAVDQQFVYSQCASGCTGTGLPNADTLVTFTISAKSVFIRNDDTTDDIYIDFAGAAATAADFRLPPGAAVSFSNGSRTNKVRLMCSGASTCLMMLLATN
jgi:hypothetical protein